MHELNHESEIRSELAQDFAAIRDIHTRALGAAEARLVELLRNRTDVIALVAVAKDEVLGHVMFSPMTIENAPRDFRAMGLAPMSVKPEFQKQGIGSRLIRAGLESCKVRGFDAVFVLGHTTYYPRFGFLRAKKYGLDNEYNAEDAFMVLELRPGVLKEIDGLVKYVPEFQDLGC